MNKLLLEVMPDQIPDYNWHRTVLCLMVRSVSFIPLMIFWSWSLIILHTLLLNQQNETSDYIHESWGVKSEDRHDKSSLIVSSTLGLPGVVGRWRWRGKLVCPAQWMKFNLDISHRYEIPSPSRHVSGVWGCSDTRLGKGTWLLLHVKGTFKQTSIPILGR